MQSLRKAALVEEVRAIATHPALQLIIATAGTSKTHPTAAENGSAEANRQVSIQNFGIAMENIRSIIGGPDKCKYAHMG
jgi:hypothetical protein